jgi:hypothetical protein
LLGNGIQTSVSAATNINKYSRDNKQNNRGHLTVRYGDLSSGRVAHITGTSFVNYRDSDSDQSEVTERFVIQTSLGRSSMCELS